MLVYDRRASLAEKSGTHALVIGISKYRYLSEGETENTHPVTRGLAQLSSAARSAFIFQNWLRENADHLVAPLKSVRLLLSPSAAEAEEITDSDLPFTNCGTEDVSAALYDWREDAARDPSDVTIFYFCGHGFDLGSSKPYMVLGDCGAPRRAVLAGTMAVDQLVQGLAPTTTLPKIARTQLYFIDTGRRRISFDTEPAYPPAIFDLFPPLLDDRQMAICHASSEGERAWAVLGGASLFLAGLIRCLRGQAAVPASTASAQQAIWQITINSLAQALPEVVRDIGQQAGTPSLQRVSVIATLTTDAVLVRLPEPPFVPVIFAFDPPQASEQADITIDTSGGERVVVSATSREAGRKEFHLAAGAYVVNIEFQNDVGPAQRFIGWVTPPRVVWEITADAEKGYA